MNYCVREESMGYVARYCSYSDLEVPRTCQNNICFSTSSCTTDGCNHGNGRYAINHLFAFVGILLALAFYRKEVA